MIKSFAHKGLEAFFRSGSRRGIVPAHAAKLDKLLAALNRARKPLDMNLPNWRLHPLKGDAVRSVVGTRQRQLAAELRLQG